MSELTYTLNAMRETKNRDQRFFAAIQGIDLGGESSQQNNPQKEWDDLKARVFSGGAAKDSNDIISLQGISAEQVGFGIGMGLDYENLKEEPTNPFS
jgi:translation initiation factor 1 (eIF-1/SUI1)